MCRKKQCNDHHEEKVVWQGELDDLNLNLKELITDATTLFCALDKANDKEKAQADAQGH